MEVCWEEREREREKEGKRRTDTLEMFAIGDGGGGGSLPGLVYTVAIVPSPHQLCKHKPIATSCIPQQQGLPAAGKRLA